MTAPQCNPRRVGTSKIRYFVDLDLPLLFILPSDALGNHRALVPVKNDLTVMERERDVAPICPRVLVPITIFQ